MSIDKYDPIRILGEGSFGKVYLMRDKIRRTFVCVKVIKIKNIPKKEREATRMEVDLLRRLHHPNIVRYIDSFLSKNNESLCICMEYCDGGDLASQIKAARRNLFGESKILHWFVQLGLGLHYMHTNKVLHRDLKTQNVFLLGNGRLVLGDLGISKVSVHACVQPTHHARAPPHHSATLYFSRPLSTSLVLVLPGARRHDGLCANVHRYAVLHEPGDLPKQAVQLQIRRMGARVRAV